jgi:hypothetical protein
MMMRSQCRLGCQSLRRHLHIVVIGANSAPSDKMNLTATLVTVGRGLQVS